MDHFKLFSYAIYPNVFVFPLPQKEREMKWIMGGGDKSILMIQFEEAEMLDRNFKASFFFFFFSHHPL